MRIALLAPFVSLALAPPAAGAEEPQPIAAWKKAVDQLFEDLQGTVRRRDQIAFEKQLAALVEQGATPRADFRKDLGSRLGRTPPGVALSAITRRLVADGSEEAVGFLFDALTTPVFVDLQGRDLGEKETESRRRILEYYTIRLGDAAWEARTAEPPAKKSPLELSQELETRLLLEIGAEDPRRIRCAAYLLGGAGSKRALAGLVQALDKLEKHSLTKSIVLEAVGRIDAPAAAAALEAAAAAKNEQVRLAALPPLGLVPGENPGKLIKEAAESPKWAVRRAAFEACKNRRDLLAMDVLMSRYPKESPRLQLDILKAVHDITGGAVPPDPREWTRWWKTARAGFQPGRKGGGEDPAKGKTVVVSAVPRYFGIEVWSSQLAIVVDISGSMNSSNVSLGSSGVGVAGALKEGAPIAIAKDQIQQLLKALSAKAQFNVVAYNQEVKPYKEALLPATKPNVQGAAKFVEGLVAEGGTNIHDSLLLALKDQNVDTIYLLSDGEPTDGQRLHPDDILEAVNMVNRFRKTRINAVQLGEDQELMRELAASSGGKYQLLEVGEAAVKKGAADKKPGGKKSP